MVKEADAGHDPFAPSNDLRNSDDFRIKAHLIGKSLWSKYSLAHEKQREEEMVRYHDGISWAGPAKFALPIVSVLENIPNEKVLQSVENTLSSICEWPNARNQAFQIKELIKYGAGAKLYSEVVQIVDLVAKIAKEKPYGDQTIGTDLLKADWTGSIYWNGDSENKTKMNELFKKTIGELTEFADGKYEYCINDYPMGLFWKIKKPDMEKIFLSMSTKDRMDVIRNFYPILLERPDLAKSLGISIG
jgi:hypothetical protein